MGSNKLTTIDETQCSSSSQSPENSFLQLSPTKPTITKIYSNKGKFMRYTNRSCNVILHTNSDDTFIRFSGTVTVHNLIFQINSGMEPRAKRPESKIPEQHMKELYERFDNKQIDPQELLKELYLLSQMENKLEFYSLLIDYMT
ncbi:unnamed protein product [Rotaria socialis]|uniref:Uncharacterized protein n=1 Tax=Rotaria socialis TaxID=392032 RepID=A0A817YX09_9BILA|nr:unnamed protein product [Rotaria socialis]